MDKMKRILFVEDNAEYREKIAQILRVSNYEVDAVENAVIGIEKFVEKEYDLVLSDLQMEMMNGVRFISYIKKINPMIKTIILTGEPTADSEIKALTIEIDKYLRKDIRMDVLLKYIEMVLEIPTSVANSELILESRIDNLIVNVAKHQVMKNGEPAELTTKEYEILCFLLKNKGYPVSREQFIEAIWDSQHEDVDLRVIDSHLKSLRKKLQLVSITAIRGYGYKWNE